MVPRGFTRFLGTLASLSDEGVKIHLIPGNHDIWVFRLSDPRKSDCRCTAKALPAHGMGATSTWVMAMASTKGDSMYRMLQSIFKNRIIQWFYARIHPNGSMAFAHRWSKKSRQKTGEIGSFTEADREHQVQFARKELEKNPSIEYFVFGHRHLPFDIHISDKSRVICLGDWIGNFTYGVFDGKEFHLKKFLPDQGMSGIDPD